MRRRNLGSTRYCLLVDHNCGRKRRANSKATYRAGSGNRTSPVGAQALSWKAREWLGNPRKISGFSLARARSADCFRLCAERRGSSIGILMRLPRFSLIVRTTAYSETRANRDLQRVTKRVTDGIREPTVAGAFPHESCCAPLLLSPPNRGNPGRIRDRGPEAQHRQRHTAGYDPTLPPSVLVVGASRMHLQDDYHLMSLTLKGNNSGGKHFPSNSYVNSEKCHGRLVGNGREWWNCALIDAVFSLRFSPRSRNAAQESFFR